MFLMLLTALLSTTASAAEYRELELADGRTIRGEVLESADTGLRLKLQQGITFIEYSQIQQITAIDGATWRAQPPWRAVAPPFSATEERLEGAAVEATGLVGDALNDFPNVQTLKPDAGLSVAQSQAIVDCDGDPRCVLEPARKAGLDLVVLGEVSAPVGGDDTLTVTAVYTASERARRTATIPWSEDDERANVVALNVLYAALDLEPDAERVQALIDAPPLKKPLTKESDPKQEQVTGNNGETSVLPDPKTRLEPIDSAAPVGLTRSQVMALSFVPIPGFPSLYQRDLRRFGLSWAAVVPGTAMFVGAGGAAAIRKQQFVALGVAGYYVTTVAVNQVMGVHTLEGRTLLALRPVEGGGVAEFSVSFR